MILVAVFLIAAPLVLVPNQRISTLIGLFLILLGIPVYYIFIWERYRPQIFNKISGMLCYKYLSMKIVVIHFYLLTNVLFYRETN